MLNTAVCQAMKGAGTLFKAAHAACCAACPLQLYRHAGERAPAGPLIARSLVHYTHALHTCWERLSVSLSQAALRAFLAGSYFQATYLAGTLYARAMRVTGQTGTTCHGPDCFRAAFLVNAALSAAALCTALALWQRTRPLYAKVVAVTRAERARRGLQARCDSWLSSLGGPPANSLWRQSL